MEPFITLENKVYGPWGLCCRSKPLPYGPEVSPLEHFNGETMQRIRKDMLDHNITEEIKHLCGKCLDHEKMGVTSRRQQKLNIPLPKTQYEFYSVEVKFFGNLCNLKCKMCSAEYSSSIAADEKKQGIRSGPIVYNGYELTNKEKFYSDMESILPHTKILKFTGGEPTMNAGIISFIDWIVEKRLSKHLVLKIITNGTSVNPKLIERSKSFKDFIVSVSVDGTWDIDEYQRTGTVFENVINSIKIYKKNADVTLSPVITALNVENVPELEVLAKVLDVPVDWESIVAWPRHMRIEVLPIPYRDFLVKKYNYPKEILSALSLESHDEEGFKILLEKNPDIFDYIPNLKAFI